MTWAEIKLEAQFPNAPGKVVSQAHFIHTSVFSVRTKTIINSFSSVGSTTNTTS